MAIIVNLDVVLAQKKMSVTELVKKWVLRWQISLF